MASATRICRVCGKTYEYCRTLKRIEGVFRWQDVACCPEHGSIYLAKIEASRAISKPTVDVVNLIKDTDEYNDVDILFEEDFNDSEDELDLIIK